MLQRVKIIIIMATNRYILEDNKIYFLTPDSFINFLNMKTIDERNHGRLEEYEWRHLWRFDEQQQYGVVTCEFLTKQYPNLTKDKVSFWFVLQR